MLIVLSFSGWQLQNRQKEMSTYQLKKTVETYLPLIPSKVMEFTTIETYLEYLEKLSMSCNMPFVNITSDVRAAMNAYKFVWSNPERFKNVVIHLGDFHFIKMKMCTTGGWKALALVLVCALSFKSDYKHVLIQEVW